jgi:diacylglycerol kinase family enzyme
MARLRERRGYRSRLGKMLGAASALITLALRPRMFRVMANIDGEIARVATPMLAVTNNPIGSDRHWSVQHRLDGGVLGYYALSSFSLKDLGKLALGYLRNRLHDDDIVESRTVQNIKLRRLAQRGVRRGLQKRARLTASMDGEIVRLANPVVITLRKRCLSLLAHEAGR